MRYAALALLLAAPAAAADRATATGKITDAAGKPLEHASVLVYEGRVKSGYSIYCPTCWADCGKRAITDAEGNYVISGLDPDLRFKLLAVKDGYSAEFIDNVDPAKGPAETASLKPRPPLRMLRRSCAAASSTGTARRCAMPSWSRKVSATAAPTAGWAIASAPATGSTSWL